MSRIRSKARFLAVQAIYQWQMTKQDTNEIIDYLYSNIDKEKVDYDYFQILVKGVLTEFSMLDSYILPHIDRSIDSIDPVERAILRLGAYELIVRIEIPFKVVINEAIEMAKVFGAEQGHKFINGALDKLAKDLNSSKEPRVNEIS
tara:strand:+ start:5384 stop:5821 length:438 start_codon:yes stop_codon:yes gene_type:complete